MAALPLPAIAPPSTSVAVARASAFWLAILSAALVACAVAGFAVTQHNDQRHADERHDALQTALDEFHAAFGDTDHFDDSELRLIERRSGLRDLQFGSDPAGQGREVQSLHDAQGRIVGWFSWMPDRDLVRAMDWLWALAGLAAVALALCGLVAARVTGRVAGSLVRSLKTIRRLTSEDQLTGLPNHRVMIETLAAALNRGDADKVAFALVDLDGFGEVNDTFGRAGGDAMLVQIADRLAAAVPEEAVLGRFEDDEFAVILSGADPGTALALAETLRAAMAAPLELDQSWQITAGIGVAQAPEDGATAEDLVRRAGMALRAAKHEGRAATRRFAPQIETEQSDRRFLLRELKSAIAAETFDVHYQPVVAAAGGVIVGVEALARWTHPSRGAIAPATFIPLAEQHGLMSALGEIVLRRALTDALRWPDLYIAVNLSPVQIRDHRLVDAVGALMGEIGIAAGRVVLEVTEGIVIDDPHDALARLEALRALGVSIALDDFGTGYSSLSYLQKFPFERVKIDRAFIASLGSVGNAGAIIQSIVTLGHALGMSVLAEGVETDEQRVLLRLAGCNEMQGYLFARPQPAEAIDELLARRASRGSANRQADAATR